MARKQSVNPTAQQSLGKLEGKTPLVVLLALVLAIGAVGYVVFAHVNEAVRQDKYHELSTIGDLKVSQIAGWLDQRGQFRLRPRLTTLVFFTARFRRAGEADRVG